MSGIKAGDLVMVTKPQPCCGRAIAIGMVFTVAAMVTDGGKCTGCGKRWKGELVAVPVGHPASGCIASRLIRIDPPALPESIDTEREVTA